MCESVTLGVPCRVLVHRAGTLSPQESCVGTGTVLLSIFMGVQAAKCMPVVRWLWNTSCTVPGPEMAAGQAQTGRKIGLGFDEDGASE